MQGERHPARVALRDARERVLERLSEGFTQDELGLDEFERRVDDAYRAASIEALAPIIADLSPQLPKAGALAPAARADALSTAEAAPRAARVAAILSSLERGGRFQLVHGMRALAVLGNLELDLRDVVLPPGVTELYVRAVFGNVEITPPPDLAVECEGSGLLGNISSLSRLPPEGEGGPVLRVVGSVFAGNIEIHTRPRALPALRARVVKPT